MNVNYYNVFIKSDATHNDEKAKVDRVLSST